MSESVGWVELFARPIALLLNSPSYSVPSLANLREWKRWVSQGLNPSYALKRTLPNGILSLMAADDPIDEISRIEAQIEELAEIAERCRKIILVSKVAIATGAGLLLLMILGLFGSSQVAAIGSIAAVLGGIVSLGSNVGTLRQSMAAISAAETLRSELIGGIDLRVVGDGTMKRI